MVWAQRHHKSYGGWYANSGQRWNFYLFLYDILNRSLIMVDHVRTRGKQLNYSEPHLVGPTPRNLPITFDHHDVPKFQSTVPTKFHTSDGSKPIMLVWNLCPGGTVSRPHSGNKLLLTTWLIFWLSTLLLVRAVRHKSSQMLKLEDA